MRITDFKENSAKKLNESLAKRFGKKINLESFTLEQLQDARNKLRTKLSQFETNESYNAVQSDTYQKSKLMLDVLNAEINERSHVVEADDCDETCPKSCPDCGGTGDPKKYAAMKEAAKPDYIDLDKDGDKKEPMKKAAKDAKKKKVDEDQVDEFDGVDSQRDSDQNLMKVIQKKFGQKKGRNLSRISGDRYRTGSGDPADMDVALNDPAVKMMLDAGVLTLNPSALKKYKAMKGESIVREGAEDHAELVMAAKDMVDRLTGWMEDTAEMQTESMLELADAIRDEMGAEQSQTFTDTVKPALESLYAAMETTRVSLTQGVGQITGEAEPMDTMGADDDMPMDDAEADMEMPMGDGDVDLGDFEADAAAAGGDEEAGREKRESVMRKRKMLETSRRLGAILSKKK
jgi:hypothetical protein